MTSTPTRIPEWTIGDRMRKSRDLAGLTAEEMSAKLRALGLKASNGTTVTNWERDANRPQNTLGTLQAWADITGVPMWWLVTGQDLPGSASAWNSLAA